MTTGTTEYFGFTIVKDEAPSVNDWAATYWNWKRLDGALYKAVTGHKHDGVAALNSPSGTLALSNADVGGTLLSRTYYMCITFLDASGLETAKSATASIVINEGLAAPSAPTLTSTGAHTGGLTGTQYSYKLAYAKGAGETLASTPLVVNLPGTSEREIILGFTSLTAAANGADKIIIYRKSGTSGSYVKLTEITNTATTSYTDDNTGVPTCDKAPTTVNTTGAENTLTIDWSDFDVTDVDAIRIYTNTTDVWTGATLLVTEVDLTVATPPSSYIWTGTPAVSTGKPPAITQTLANPSKIDLTSEVTGILPAGNLPADVGGVLSVATYADLPVSSYVVQENAWFALETRVLDAGFFFATEFTGKGNVNYSVRFFAGSFYGKTLGDEITLEIRADNGGHPSDSVLYTQTYAATADDLDNSFVQIKELDFGQCNLTDGTTYFLVFSSPDGINTQRGDTLSRWESNTPGSWSEYTSAGISYQIISGAKEDFNDAYMVEESNEVYTWDYDAQVWKVTGRKYRVQLGLPSSWDDLGADGIGPAEMLVVRNEDPRADANKEIGLYIWRDDWATPAWQRLNTFLPMETSTNNNTGFSTAEVGICWLRHSDFSNMDYLVAQMPGGVYSIPLSTDNQTVGALPDALGYLGWWETGMEDIEPNYGYGAVRFNWDSKKFEYWDDTIATPAWIEVP